MSPLWCILRFIKQRYFFGSSDSDYENTQDLLNAVHTDYKIRKIYSNIVLTDYKNTQDLLKCRKY